jgi:hypothetical protein
MKTNNIKKEKGMRHESIKVKIYNLVSRRNDIKISMLPALLNTTETVISSTLTMMRKQGIKIFPSKGPGTPLKIAMTVVECAKYINWRRHCFLDTSTRMVTTETEIGEQYKELAGKSEELLTLLANARTKKDPLEENQ